MCHKSISICYDCVDLCFWISTFIVPFLTYLIIQKLRPRIEITSFIKDEDCIKVKVVNKSRCFDANNLRIEICAITQEKDEAKTIHLDPDRNDFLILPRRGWFCKKDNSRTFKCTIINEHRTKLLKIARTKSSQKESVNSVMEKLNNGYKLRVRCHAYHSFSGLGKSFEKIF
ncbi:MAG: hypothetical protein FGM14_00970 [Flavobacteriales bacterium]|nr:hypothetical protein [Flavobacteriales bacterium]